MSILMKPVHGLAHLVVRVLMLAGLAVGASTLILVLDRLLLSDELEPPH